MTNKIIISFFLFLTLSTISCKNKNNEISSDKPNSNNVFTTLEYDKAIAYNYDGEGDIEIIDNNGKLASKIKKKITLTKPQVIKLTNIFCSKSTYGGDVAGISD